VGIVWGVVHRGPPRGATARPSPRAPAAFGREGERAECDLIGHGRYVGDEPANPTDIRSYALGGLLGAESCRQQGGLARAQGPRCAACTGTISIIDSLWFVRRGLSAGPAPELRHSERPPEPSPQELSRTRVVGPRGSIAKARKPLLGPPPGVVEAQAQLTLWRSSARAQQSPVRGLSSGGVSPAGWLGDAGARRRSDGRARARGGNGPE
jgi:hypothetical protein